MFDMVASSSFEQEQSYDWSSAIEVIPKEMGTSFHTKPHQKKEVYFLWCDIYIYIYI